MVWVLGWWVVPRWVVDVWVGSAGWVVVACARVCPPSLFAFLLCLPKCSALVPPFFRSFVFLSFFFPSGSSGAPSFGC